MGNHLKQIILFLCGSFLLAQNSSFQEITQQWYEAYYQKDFNKVLSLSYPEIFNIVPQDDLKKSFETSFENDQFSMFYVEKKPTFEYSQQFDLEEGKFIIMNFMMYLGIKFKVDLPEQTIEYLKKEYQQKMKADEVIYEPKNNTFVIKRKDINLLINNNLTNNTWKIVNFEPSQKGFVHYIFGDDFNQKIGF